MKNTPAFNERGEPITHHPIPREGDNFTYVNAEPCLRVEDDGFLYFTIAGPPAEDGTRYVTEHLVDPGEIAFLSDLPGPNGVRLGVKGHAQVLILIDWRARDIRQAVRYGKETWLRREKRKPMIVRKDGMVEADANAIPPP